MIVSHRHRFIFFAVPKTATHAIRQALIPALGEDDWQQQSLYGNDRLPIPALASVGHGHLSVTDVLPHLPDDIWRDYRKFAFVRNPFDRFVSTCFFLFRGDESFAASATENMKAALRRPRFRQRVLVKPQYTFLAGADGRLAMDIVGRFETLQASFDELCTGVGIPRAVLKKKNPSDHRHFADYYDEALTRLVVDCYERDFEAFGYSPEPAADRN
jgi:hypothetical protein